MEQLPDQVLRDLLPFVTNLKLGGLKITVKNGIILDAALTGEKCFSQKIPLMEVKTTTTD